LLRLPSPGERLPPLVVPLRAAAPETVEDSTSAQESGDRRKKRKSRRAPGGHSWDRSPGKGHRARPGEKRQMFWMLVAGGGLFALVVLGVVGSMLGGRGKGPARAGADSGKPAAAPVVTAAAVPEKSDSARLADAEPVIRGFLEATRVDDLLGYVRHPETAEPRMRRHYPGGVIQASGLSEIVIASGLTRTGRISSVSIRTGSHEEKPIAFEETPQGVKIDWESWVGWSEMPWAGFMEARPTSASLFRVNLSAVDYFNFAFSDDRKWQSYRLESPDGEHALFGYVEAGSVLDSRLKPPPDVKRTPMTLSLKFPENAASPNQVIIEELVAEGWVLETSVKP